MAFEKRDNRAITKTNIYLKNLPDLSENEIFEALKESCKIS